MILTKDILLTTQGAALSEHKEYLNYVIFNHPDIVTPNSIFSYLIEANINDIEKDFKKIVSFFDNMSQAIFYTEGSDNSTILKGRETDLKQNINNIGRYGHLISKHRESLISIRRALSFIARSEQIKLSSMELEKFNDSPFQIANATL
jgi:Mg2+ and Co2+ transporter CorA